MPASAAREFERNREGVQLIALVGGEIVVNTEHQQGWSEVRFNMTSAESRSLAAHLIAAADSKDHVDASAHITRKLDKLAEALGIDIAGA